MSQVHFEIQSFNAGELSPLLGQRFNVEKVQSGCRRLRNFLLHVHGPAFRRPGMEYLGTAAGNGARSRLLPFNFSTTTGAILELHPSGMRVWAGGAQQRLRTEVPLPYSETECGEVQMVQVNDVCYLAHPNHAPRKLTRYADDDWRIAEIPWKWPALGDENVRSDEIAAPATTELLSVPTQEWPEVTFVQSGGITSSDVTFSVINPDLTAATKTAKVQRINPTTGLWVTEHTFSWTTSAPSVPWEDNWTRASNRVRLTYVGPVTPTGIVRFEWAGGSTGTLDLPIDIVQPVSDRECTVGIGDWQATVASPASIPAGVKLHLMRWNGSVWAQEHEMKLLAGQTTVYRGAKLAATRRYKFNWDGKAMAGIAKIEQIEFPVSTEITLAIDVTSGNDRTLTASAPLFLPEHVGSYWQVTHRREHPWVVINSAVTSILAANSAALRVQGKWQVTSYGVWAATLYLEKYVGGVWTTLRSWTSSKDRNIIADGEEDHAVDLRLRISAGTSEAATGADNPRFVLEAFDAEINGLVKVTAIGDLTGGKATEATVDVVSPLFSTDATAIWTEGAWSEVKGYPRCLALHGGRLWFGGTRTEPMRIWGSVINDYEDFRRTSFDDAGLSFVPAAQGSNAMQWMLSHEKELVFGTAGDEWTLGTESGPITPTNILVQRRSSYGSDNAAAVLVNESLIFVQRGGRKLRQVAPRADSVAWSASDLTVLAEHVTQKGVAQIAAMTNPFSVLWVVTTDGKLLGMTYEVEQNVFGWHVHETDGIVESVAVIRGANVDEVWMQVSRGGVRTIERFDSRVMERRFDEREKLIYLDCALLTQFAGAPQLVVAGLDHLNGRTVSICVDGYEQPPRVVLNGRITLDTAGTWVAVGLPYTSELQPMRVDIPLRDGTSQGRKFKVARAVLMLHESLGGEVAESPEGRFQRINNRVTSDPMDTVSPLLNGQTEVLLQSGARDGIDVIVRQTAPLPFNIAGIVVKADLYGE
jgi:hypothetical protein